MQKKLISYLILVIVPKQSLCQPLFMYSRSVFCVLVVVFYWYRCTSACAKNKGKINKKIKINKK